MSGSAKDRLYGLLPAIFRIRDADEQTLRALVAIIEEQFTAIEADVEGLRDDWFIETCAEWVVPYIGDLLGARRITPVDSAGLYSQRALVANTIRHRRRKGTLHMLEAFSRDVTGWHCRATAFFELLAWTQHLDHLRRTPAAERQGPAAPPAFDRVSTLHVRNLDLVDRVGGPFDEAAHTIDVRRPQGRGGWHNIRNVGIFLWRLQSYPLHGVTPRPSAVAPEGFHFSPLGNPAPLFTNPLPEEDVALATELHVPGAIRSMAFHDNRGGFYGASAAASVRIYAASEPRDDALIASQDVMCKNLGTWSSPPAGKVAIDVARGRLMFAPGEVPGEGVSVLYHYGFAGDVGGGPYTRTDSVAEPRAQDWEVIVAKSEPNPAPTEWRTTIRAALDDWDRGAHPRAVITIADNATYEEELVLVVHGGDEVVLQAADRMRPMLRLVDAGGATAALTITGTAAEGSGVTLSGLLIEGAVHLDAAKLAALLVTHCTLTPGIALGEDGAPTAPGDPSLAVADGALVDVRIEASIVGALRVPTSAQGLHITESIVDHPPLGPGDPRPAITGSAVDSNAASLTLERVTVLGDLRVGELELVTDSILAGGVETERLQVGCVRYSSIEAPDARTPRRYRCQPDHALEHARRTLEVSALTAEQANVVRLRVLPQFVSTTYGTPGYAQLEMSDPDEILQGSEATGEMGVFERLRQAQRESNLHTSLEEYMPFGMSVALVYVT